MKKLSLGTVFKNISRVHKIVKYAISEVIIVPASFIDWEYIYIPQQQKYITSQELDKIMNSQLDHPNRYLASDIFLFSRILGLAHIDIKSLKEEHLIQISN